MNTDKAIRPTHNYQSSKEGDIMHELKRQGEILKDIIATQERIRATLSYLEREIGITATQERVI